MAHQIRFHSDTLSNTVVAVAEESAILRWFDAFNKDDAVFVQLFDAKRATDVTLGTTAPTYVFGVPEGGGHDYFERKTQGIIFDKGLCIACTATATGSGAPASSPNVNIQLLRNV